MVRKASVTRSRLGEDLDVASWAAVTACTKAPGQEPAGCRETGQVGSPTGHLGLETEGMWTFIPRGQKPSLGKTMQAAGGAGDTPDVPGLASVTAARSQSGGRGPHTEQPSKGPGRPGIADAGHDLTPPRPDTPLHPSPVLGPPSTQATAGKTVPTRGQRHCSVRSHRAAPGRVRALTSSKRRPQRSERGCWASFLLPGVRETVTRCSVAPRPGARRAVQAAVLPGLRARRLQTPPLTDRDGAKPRSPHLGKQGWGQF